MKKLKINTYTDESGQDTQGRTFIVCTAIVNTETINITEKQLLEIENKSKKIRKWHNSNSTKRKCYIDFILEQHITDSVEIYYTQYQNKLDYINLVGSHIAKTIISCVNKQEYSSKIFVDKIDKQAMLNLGKEIRSFHIRYKKIRGITEEASPFIRLVDAICGMIRDINDRKCPKSYQILLSKIKPI